MTPAERDMKARAAMGSMGSKRNPSEDSWQHWASEQAHWDESHIQPSVEYIKEGKDPEEALTLVEDDLGGWRQQWREQNADTLAEFGLRTNAAIDGAWEKYKDEYLYLVERRMDHIAPKKNPGRKSRRNPGEPTEERKAAIDKFKDFHRYEHRKVGDFHASFSIPKEMIAVGDAKWVTYRSDKVDPSTLKKPRNPVNYIHEFNAGVQMYLPLGDAFEFDDIDDKVYSEIDVPEEFTQVQTLVKLGENLGYEWEWDGGETCEANATEPFPELYCTPDGSCLLVIQSKKEVLAMIWGGALGVYPRGIDG